ncbi:MAG: hypothetical protein ACLRMN_06860 [Mediterraneibacter gnavus]
MNSLDFMNTNNFIHIDTTSSLYVFANLFSNTAYTFLQILIAFSVCKSVWCESIPGSCNRNDHN